MGVAMGGRGPSGQCWALRGHWTLMSSLGGVQTGLLSYSDSGTQDRQLISLPLPHVHLIPSKAIDSLRAGPWLSPPALPHHLAPDIPRKNLSVDPRDDQGHTDSPGAITEPSEPRLPCYKMGDNIGILYRCYNATSPRMSQRLVNRYSVKKLSYGQRFGEFWGKPSSAGFFTAGLLRAFKMANVH